MATLHFSLGSELGKRLTEIAQEKLLYDLDPNKAIETFTKALCGFPIDLAIRCLTGKDLKLYVEGDEIKLTDEEILDYPTHDFEEYVKRWKDEFDEILKTFERPLLNHANFGNRVISIPIRVRDLFIGYDQEEAENPYEFLGKALIDEAQFALDDSEYRKTITDLELYKLYKDWRTLSMKRIKVIEFLRKNKIIEETSIDSVMVNQMSWFEQRLQNSIYLNDSRPEDDPVTKFIKAAEEIDNVKELKPLHDDEFTNASWISPEGVRYGLNGEIANMLHITIANMLLEQGVIKPTENLHKKNPYSYLEENGWVKIHNDWVMFEPNTFDEERPKNFITESQIERLSNYLDNHCDRHGKFGIQHQIITTPLLRAMDQFALNKLFEI